MNLKFQPYSATLLTIGGIILMGMGIYFALLRPALLPEDMRYIGVSAAQLEATAPDLSNWLERVLWVLGGYILTSGILTCYVAQTAFRERRQGVFLLVSIAGLSSIGLMVVINFVIASDYKWLLLAFAVPWLIALWLYQRHQ